MKPFLALPLITLITAGALAADLPAHDSQVLLWPEGAPEAKGNAPTDQPALTHHFAPEAGRSDAAVIVNPGGGYHIVASDHEGLQVARWLNSIGITAFVLRYRLLPDYEPAVSLLDAQRAIRYVRHNAERFGVSPNRIGMLGFSAGGHLTTAAGTLFDDGDPTAADPIEHESSRPDFIIPIYPAVDGSLFPSANNKNYRPTQELVSARTPPTFLLSTTEDTLVVPNHSIRFYQALLEHGVPAEMHIFGYGAHGLGLAPGDPQLGEWPKLAHGWMRRTGLLVDKDRVPVSGEVTLDGEPLFWGHITFTPEDPNAPVFVASIMSGANGKYSLDNAHGPVPGRHRVEVNVVSREFAAPKEGRYSIDDVETYTSEEPGGEPLVVDIPAGEAFAYSIRINSGKR